MKIPNVLCKKYAPKRCMIVNCATTWNALPALSLASSKNKGTFFVSTNELSYAELHFSSWMFFLVRMEKVKYRKKLTSKLFFCTTTFMFRTYYFLIVNRDYGHLPSLTSHGPLFGPNPAVARPMSLKALSWRDVATNPLAHWLPTGWGFQHQSSCAEHSECYVLLMEKAAVSDSVVLA